MAKRKLVQRILNAVRDERVVLARHAAARLRQRGVELWQVIAGAEKARVLEARSRSQPNPSVLLLEELPDGRDVTVVWSYLPTTDEAKLVTVYFRGEDETSPEENDQ